MNKKKSVAIIGAGFTGLSAAFELSKAGYDVSVFEFLTKPGGLAIGFRKRGWLWSLERHYHHLFVSDSAIIRLAKKIGHQIIFSKVSTSLYFQDRIYRMDSALNLLKFEPLSFINRIRVGLVLFFLKVNPFWRIMEKISAKEFLIRSMGRDSWAVLWKSLLDKKFGEFSDNVNAAWFWSRIKKRSAVLGYPEGGFQKLAKNLEKVVKQSGGNIFYNTRIKKISKKVDKFIIKTDKNESKNFDFVICTLPIQALVNIYPNLHNYYVKGINQFEGLGAINLVLSSKYKLLEDGTYWLNINQEDFPFLCIVEQTNFINNDKYNYENIIYIGVYKDKNHVYFRKSAKALFVEYKPFLERINQAFKSSWIKSIKVFKANFAQPIIPINYSKTIPSIRTPIKGLYLANMQQVYPWDRGTNYAVEIGQKVASLLLKDS